MLSARRTALLCATAMSLLISRAAISQEKQSQPPLPPVVVEQSSHQPASVMPRSKSNQRAKSQQSRRVEHRQVPPVDVAAQQAAAAAEAYRTREGSEAQGYKPTTVTNFGPFGQKPIIDVPYSVNVMSSDLLENRLASTVEDITRISPVIQTFAPSARAVGSQNFTARGFQAIPISEDGMPIWDLFAPALEDKERVEFISGLTSVLGGAYNVGGILNYVYKRPTATPIANVTVGDYGNTAGFVHGDFGGPIGNDGKLGYRLNIVGQNGDLPVDYQSNKRTLVSGALDWHVNKNTLIEVLGSYHYTKFSGIDPFWLFIGTPHRAAPDPSKYWGQPYTYSENESIRLASHLTSKLNDIFTVRAAYEFRDDDMPYASAANNLVFNNTGTFSQTAFLNPRQQNEIHSAYAYLDAEFMTGSIHHKITTGYHGDFLDVSLADRDTPFYFNGNCCSFSSPTYLPKPTDFASALTGPMYKANTFNRNSFVIGDQIDINQYLSTTIAVSDSSIDQQAYDQTVGSTHSLTSQYDKGEWTPSFSIVGKPASWISTYFTYSESLERGLIVPSSGPTTYTNAGQIFSPMTGTQYEVGAKADIGGMLLTAALFDIGKATQQDVANSDGTHTLTQSGRQENKGLELTATGNVTEGFRVFGGVSFIDARITSNESDPTLVGKRPQNVAPVLAKVTMEYDLPSNPNLTLTGGVYYTGDQSADVLNTDILPSFTTVDLGFRYRMKIAANEAILRFNIQNLTDEHYWLSSNYLGRPRTFAGSLQVPF